jgi:alpha-ketoglutaric semialdehyde dehydrogenase
MKITGALLIGQSEVFAEASHLKAFNPATGQVLSPSFTAGDASHVDRACTLATAAFDSYRETTLADRAAFLRAIGAGLLALGDTLIDRAHEESGLPKARLAGERGRTIGQLEMFAKIVEDGRWIGATIDTAMPERKPLPRVDLRLRKIALGPVAIFGASNFPLAFSVAGGDAASALAAGCPIVVKAHPAHLGTSELVGRVIQKAVADCGLHEGVFSLLGGEGIEIGQSLVTHPAIKAVGFTGSRQAGLSLMKAAATRSEPIPVYAEMSSVNPMFLLPAALTANAESMARSFVDSMTLGVGQFCTNPGILIAIQGEALDRFIAIAATEVSSRAPGTMLTPGIHAAYEKGIARLASAEPVQSIARAPNSEGSCLGSAALFSTQAKQFLAKPELGEEVFGPSSLLVICESEHEMLDVAAQIEGQLTASIFAQETDFGLAQQLVPTLEKKVGRIVFNGFPTGVEVGWAMVHGGPFPATSDGRTTSVGAGAIERFLRPVSYQDFPSALLPASLNDSNPLHIPQTRDTKLQ